MALFLGHADYVSYLCDRINRIIKTMAKLFKLILCMAIIIAMPSCGEDNTYPNFNYTPVEPDNGDDNTGDDNTGDDNTGDDNTGDDNTGDDNTNDDTTGDNEGESAGKPEVKPEGDNSDKSPATGESVASVAAVAALMGAAFVLVRKSKKA